MNIFQEQERFMNAGDIPTGLFFGTGIGSRGYLDMCKRLIHEELDELEAENSHYKFNTLKEATDLLYVVLQYLNALVGSRRAMALFELVHNNNMSKVSEDGKLRKRADGKVLKPEKYRPISEEELMLIVRGI